MLFIWRLRRYFAGNKVEQERVNDEVRWSLRFLVDRFVQISSGTYLLRVDRELFHYAGRWSSSLYLGQVKSATAVDLIVPEFMAVLMVHLALTRLDRGAVSRVCAHVRQYGNILSKTGRRKRERKIEKFWLHVQYMSIFGAKIID